MQLAQGIGLTLDVVLQDRDPRINIPMRLSIGGASHPTWGYTGSGPHSTAFNILLAANLEPDLAADLYRQFAKDFLYTVPATGGILSHERINRWVEQQLRCEHPAFEYRGLGPLTENGANERIAAALGDDYCTGCGCSKRMLEARGRGDFRRPVYQPW